MIEVDVRGFSCPVPVVKTKKAMETNPGKELTVLVDAAVAKENVSRLAENQGYSVSVEKVDDEFKLTLTPPRKEG